jgi:hypothetical protein
VDFDYSSETPLRDARGFEMSRAEAHPTQLTDVAHCPRGEQGRVGLGAARCQDPELGLGPHDAAHGHDYFDYSSETPLRDARGFEMSRAEAHPTQLTDVAPVPSRSGVSEL